jgi:hypothetical protein
MDVSGQLHAPADLFQETNPGTHSIGGWVGPRAGLDIVEKENSRTAGNQTPVVQSVAYSLA